MLTLVSLPLPLLKVDSDLDRSVDFIYSVLALKLLRVLHIFTHWKVTMPIFWKDLSLSLIAVLFSLPAFLSLCLLIRGSLHLGFHSHLVRKGPIVVEERTVYVQFNYLEASMIMLIVRLVLLLLILCSSVLTCRINRNNFKDTKKVNFLLFYFLLLLESWVEVFNLCSILLINLF